MSKSRQRPTPDQSLGPSDEGVVLRWVSGEELSDIDLERLRHLLETSELARELLDAVLPNGQRTDAEEQFPAPIGGKPARTRNSLLAFLNKQPPGTRYYFRGAQRILESNSPLEALLAYVFAMQERVQRRSIRLLRASDHSRGSEARKTIVRGVGEERLNRFAAETALAEFLGSRMPARVPAEARSVRDDFMHGRKVSAAQILSACCVVIEWCTLLDKAVRHSVGQGPMDDLRFKPRTTNVDGVSDPNPLSVASTSRRKLRSESPEDPEDVRRRTLVNLQNTVGRLHALPLIIADPFSGRWDPHEVDFMVKLLGLDEELDAPQPPLDRPSNPKRQDLGGTNRTSKTLRGLEPGAIWSAVQAAGLDASSHDLSNTPHDERELALRAAMRVKQATGRSRKRVSKPLGLEQLVVVHTATSTLVLQECRLDSSGSALEALNRQARALQPSGRASTVDGKLVMRVLVMPDATLKAVCRLDSDVQWTLFDQQSVHCGSSANLRSLLKQAALPEARQEIESQRTMPAPHRRSRRILATLADYDFGGRAVCLDVLRKLLDQMGWHDIGLPSFGKPIPPQIRREILERTGALDSRWGAGRSTAVVQARRGAMKGGLARS